QLTATAQRKARNGRNDRLTSIGDAITVTEQVVEVDLRVFELGHFLDISARSERLGRTCQDDAADIPIAFELVKGMVEFADQR
nr:hypothetical protein [Tanacetum cinerariifolium]